MGNGAVQRADWRSGLLGPRSHGIHTKNTVVYLCYGCASITTDQSSPASVWDSHYLAVWHLADKEGLDLSNSADPKFALTNPGPVSSALGKIGGGTKKFEDSTYYLDNPG